MYRIILCLILNAVSMPFSFAITSCLTFSVISKTCRVELQQRQQGKISVQQNFIKEECKTAIDLCEDWANENAVEGKCRVNQNQDQQIDTSVGCVGDCQPIGLPNCYGTISRCPSIDQYCGGKPLIGANVEDLIQFRKCVRKIEACENGEIKYPADFN